jgi:hypothetical protein
MLSILLTLLPALGSLVAGGKAKDLVSIGTQVAQQIFGTSVPGEIVEAMRTDPASVDLFKARLTEETERLRVELADTADARQQTIKLAEIGSPLLWAPAILSGIIITAFVFITAAMLFRAVPDSQIVMVLFGQLSGLTGGVMQYWLGSSQSSRAKDAELVRGRR